MEALLVCVSVMLLLPYWCVPCAWIIGEGAVNTTTKIALKYSVLLVKYFYLFYFIYIYFLPLRDDSNGKFVSGHSETKLSNLLFAFLFSRFSTCLQCLCISFAALGLSTISCESS